MEAINQEFQHLEALKLSMPNIEAGCHDLEIWEGMAQQPTLRVSNSGQQENKRAWELPGEYIIFRRQVTEVSDSPRSAILTCQA